MLTLLRCLLNRCWTIANGHCPKTPRLNGRGYKRAGMQVVAVSIKTRFAAALVLLAAFAGSAAPAVAAPVLKVLFLGDNGHHKPAERFRSFAPVMMNRGIQLVYTEDLAALRLETLQRYDAVLIYANIDTLAPDAERALIDYVTQGGGLFALHCASYCFRNSERYIALVGAQFSRHGAIAPFRTRLTAPDNPVLQGFTGFESADEPYVHVKHNEQNRTILEVRETEPYTWTRTEGKGRVFYTAWGHDERTWTNPGFQDLVERGIRFAAGQKLPDALANRPVMPALELVDQAGIPYYPPGQRSQGEFAWPKMQKPLSPAESMQHIVVPGGFELQLVASEPDIRKPISLAWDERGRLWIAESLDYPNTVRPPNEPGRDRLVICEDTNGDGRMDKFTVFADGLNIPTGFTFANGGVIVHQAPDTIFLKDTDGDDRADLREVLFTGWGRRDTHAGPNNLQYGFDNWIYGMVGYSSFKGTVGGRELAFSQGFVRFRADGSQLEYLRATNNNTWGLGFSEDGLVFGSTANNNPSVYLPFANRYYPLGGLEPRTLGGIAATSRFLPMTDRVRQVDVHWGYTAAAGHALYTARAFPKEYWDRIAFVTEPTGHLVGQFNLERSYGNVRSVNPTNLVASDDEWCAPIFADVGPDGAVWVIDWYNYIVQHNPTPRGFPTGAGNAYENRLRDQTYGRIYRVVWKDGKPSTAPRLHGATPAELVAALKNDNLFWRRHAQRLLVERGRKDVVPALLALVRDTTTDEIGLNVGAIHALWTLQGLNALDALPATAAVAREALRHPSAGVRRTAALVLPRSVENGSAMLEAGLLDDRDGQVRLAALLALAEIPDLPEAGAAIRTALAKPDFAADRWTVDAAKIAGAVHHKSFLAGVSPAEIAAARQVEANVRQNLIPNGNFDAAPATAGIPEGWSFTNLRGTVTASLVEHAGRNDTRALRLASGGGEVSGDLIIKIPVRKNHRYELNGWIKPENITTTNTAVGALFSVLQLQGPGQRFSTGGMRGTRNWTQQRVAFESGTAEQISIACILGGGGTADGAAYFDDLSLIDLGPIDETVNEPFKLVLAHVADVAQGAVLANAHTVDNEPNATKLELGVVPDVMKYDRTELTVRAGARARLVFKNNDHMQHNMVIVRPGTLDAVGALADQLLADPQAMARNFVPASPDVLFSTPLVNPGETFELRFTAPTQPGRYPFVCTFPGHWRIMQGTLVVQ
jgi:putative membrane-bound dehydrogenase-like protein